MRCADPASRLYHNRWLMRLGYGFVAKLDVASTTATDFNTVAIGGTTKNSGVKQFALTMWLQPTQKADDVTATRTLFRVTTDLADTVPSTPKGVRFSAFIQSHISDSLRRGF